MLLGCCVSIARIILANRRVDERGDGEGKKDGVAAKHASEEMRSLQDDSDKDDETDDEEEAWTSGPDEDAAPLAATA
mgnify:CR=1 FL=1